MKTSTIFAARLPLIALPFLAACAPDGAPAPEGSPAAAAASPLENAPEDTENKFAVGVCSGPLSGGTSGTCSSGRCTGTLVAPNLVLTARHCVNFPTASDFTALCTNTADNFFDDSTLKPPSSMHVTVDPSTIEGSPKWYDVSEILLPKGSHVCNDDIALLRLAGNVPAAEAAPAAADVYTDLARDTPDAVAIVGRGAIQSTWDPVTGQRLLFDNGGFRRRIVENVPVLCASNRDGDCGTLFDYTILEPPRGFTLSAGVVLVGPATHPGDSGAGLLDQARFDRGKPAVVGVHSYGGVDENGIEYAGFSVRLTQHRAFLINAAVRAARIGRYPVPAWVRRP